MFRSQYKSLGNFTLLIWLITSLHGLYGQISGLVLDSENAPIDYATVALYSTNDSLLINGTVSDENGRFVLGKVKKGRYYLLCSFIGYQTQKIENIVVDGNKSVELPTVHLSFGQQLQEVLVEGERSTVSSSIEKQIFQSDKFHSAQGGSGTDVIKNLPAVSVNGLGEISVRGATGFVVLLNGKPVQGNAKLIMDQIPANAIETIELITTPSAKYDPEGKAGIINIKTKKGAIDGAFTQINIKAGLPSIEDYGNEIRHKRFGMDGTYHLVKEKFGVAVGLNYQRNDLGGLRVGEVYTQIGDKMTVFPSTGERSFDEENYSANVAFDFFPNENNEFGIDLFAGKRDKARLADITYYDNHAFSIASPEDRYYTKQYFNHNLRIRKGDFALASMDFKHIFGDQSQFSTSLLYEYTLLGGPTVNQNIGIPSGVIEQDEYNTNDNPLNGLRFDINFASKPLSMGILEAGYQFRNLDHVGDFVYERYNPANNQFELIPEFSSEVNLVRSIHSGYAQISGNKNKWQYNFGIRLEAMDRSLELRDKSDLVDTTYRYDFIKPFPAASVQYTFDNQTKIKAAYSRRIERTTTFKMNPFPEREHSETLEQGDPLLLPEFIDLFELGASRSFDNEISIFTTLYYRDVQNVVNRVNTVYNDTILNRIYSNVGNSKSYGLELGLEFKAGENWSNFIGANFYNYKIDGEFDGFDVSTKSTIYSFNINSTYRFWENASAQFTLNYLSDQITAQGEDSRFYSPNLTIRKGFLDNRLLVGLQWLNIDMGLLDSNEQRITTWRENAFYTTTNYIYEVDMIMLNLSYNFNASRNKAKFKESEFGKREF